MAWEKQNLTKDIEHALKWLAAEFKFLKQLHEDLEKIENEDLEKQEEDLRKDKRVIRFIQKSERRVERDVRSILNRLHKGSNEGSSVSDINSVLAEIQIPANQLLKEGSMYVGELRKQLDTIRTDVDIAKKYKNEKEQQVVKGELEKLDAEVKDVMIWATALDAALQKAAKVPIAPSATSREDLYNLLIGEGRFKGMEVDRRRELWNRWRKTLKRKVLNFQGYDFSGRDLSEFNLSDGNFKGAKFERAKLKLVNLRGADLLRANLREANLQSADLQEANLHRADLKRANVPMADLRRANIKQVYLREANLESANLYETNLMNTNLDGVNLNGAYLRGTIYNHLTHWPKGFDPKAAGAILED